MTKQYKYTSNKQYLLLSRAGLDCTEELWWWPSTLEWGGDLERASVKANDKIKKQAYTVHCTRIKHDGYLRTQGKM